MIRSLRNYDRSPVKCEANPVPDSNFHLEDVASLQYAFFVFPVGDSYTVSLGLLLNQQMSHNVSTRCCQGEEPRFYAVQNLLLFTLLPSANLT